MSKFKGTPGPWRVSEKNGDIIDIRHSDNAVGAISLNLAKVVARQSWAKEAEANALLIAAAPDLLQALQNLLIRVADEEEYGQQHAVTAARVAIAKALGQPQ